MKKFLSLVLVFAMMIGCCSAFAADNPKASSGKITITVNKFVVEQTADNDVKNITTIDENKTDVVLSAASADKHDINWKISIIGGNGTPYNKTSTECKITVDDILTAVGNDISVDGTMVTITIEATGVEHNGTYGADTIKEYDPITITIPVYKIDTHSDIDPESDDPANKTDGQFTVDLTAEDDSPYYPGDYITLVPSCKLGVFADREYDESYVTYYIKAKAPGANKAASVEYNGGYEYKFATDGDYTFWAIGVLDLSAPV